MIGLGLISFVVGVALAGRYKFLVLSVATFLGLVGVAIYAHAAEFTPMSSLLAGLLFAICLQAGYLAGALFFDFCLPIVKAPVAIPAQRRWR